MRLWQTAVLVLATGAPTACNCGGVEPGTPIAVPPRGEPANPVVVRPKLNPPVIGSAPVGRGRIRPVPMLPPIVRGPQQIDVFIQEDAVVDVLWVVDNSSSLSNERDRLATQFNRFLSVLLAADVDFHVGVTSTDLTFRGDGGRLRGPSPVIDRNTPNPALAFREAVRFAEDEQIVLEEGLAAMESALSPPNSTGANAGFIRGEAALAVIVVSDEEDGSLGPVGHYIRFLRGVKGPGREVNVSLSVVAGPLPDGCVPPGEAQIFGAEARAAERYIAVAEASGGLVESICAADFAPFVQTLATTLAGLRRFFPLSAPPDVDSIEVTVDGARVQQSETNGWSWHPDERALVFTGVSVPPPGAEVLISYDVRL